ncbi:hypothetical protein ElyMa_002879900 [Elysia marginata]|uniref:BPTI/Kunitz inhibitor domain-containing protein n=1 Tax=Elysia marginata TaxID=1093978 RepID=A0AAV4HYS3_9GAST|nr:hypothetical protein ElyMa_002879900 [Elysia marginata]
MEFGAPRCVSVSGSFGSYLNNNVGLDLHRNPLALGLSLTKSIDRFGFGRCSQITPACRATIFDRFEQCKYTYDLIQRRCVRVYVRNVCAIFDGPRKNIFSSRFDCEHFCAGRLTY